MSDERATVPGGVVSARGTASTDDDSLTMYEVIKETGDHCAVWVGRRSELATYPRMQLAAAELSDVYLWNNRTYEKQAPEYDVLDKHGRVRWMGSKPMRGDEAVPEHVWRDALPYMPLDDEQAEAETGSRSVLHRAYRDSVLAAIERLRYSVGSETDNFEHLVDVVDAEELIAEVERIFAGTGDAVRCVWRQDDLEGMFTTTCGGAFEFIDGTPTENGVRFCCYCGRPATEKLYVESIDDETESEEDAESEIGVKEDVTDLVDALRASLSIKLRTSR
jgi:hypothetical protein